MTVGVAGLATGIAAAAAAARRRPYLPGGLAEYDPRGGDPLRRAVRHGLAGVQVPVWPGADGRLYVGRGEPRRLDPAGVRTLARGVLEPLLRRVAATGGQVYAGRDEPFDLLIELPGDEAAPGLAVRAYELLDACLRDHAAILTRWSATAVDPGAVTVTLTGRLSARPLLAELPERLACVDGTLDDIGSRDAPPDLAPLVSEHWSWRFGWDGRGPMSPEERCLLRELVRGAQAEGRRVRFYGVPERPRRVREGLWRELSGAGVDLIGARRLGPLARHLRRRPHPAGVRPDAFGPGGPGSGGSAGAGDPGARAPLLLRTAAPPGA
jgi:hypothetical protein